MLKLNNAVNFKNYETNDPSLAFPIKYHNLCRNWASKHDSHLSGRKHVIIEFLIAHVTYKCGPCLKWSFKLSQFELTRWGFTFEMNMKILFMLKKMKAQTQSIVYSHWFLLSFYESFQ